ncbi:phage tail protein [Pusillimonas sp. ANT_WB101]|uniref:phage tail protein n=1 Tax=Pusillimonas sp. ANT_WB101 TaxID=2597356 RepID=UPI0011EDC9A4|nr:phage tail protein [Pusillimonas sp. ANT_WB101]KAA0910853.1 phage tail protein [Pusillimonas sp. ANT_WB101]
MAKVFTWSPSIDAKGEVTYRVLEAQVGDGFKQSVGDGINNRSQSWPLTFKGHSEKILPIVQFLDEHEGSKPFEWTPPLSKKALFEMKGFSLIERGTDYYVLTAKFPQVFA